MVHSGDFQIRQRSIERDGKWLTIVLLFRHVFFEIFIGFHGNVKVK